VKGDFVNHDLDGVLVTHRVSIRVGDHGEAYVMVLRDIRQASRTTSASADMLAKVAKRRLRCATQLSSDKPSDAYSVRPTRPNLRRRSCRTGIVWIVNKDWIVPVFPQTDRGSVIL